VIVPIATPIAAIPVTHWPHPVGGEGPPASRGHPRGHPHRMVATMRPGRDYRCGQRHRNKATQEKYRFRIHRLFRVLKIRHRKPEKVASGDRTPAVMMERRGTSREATSENKGIGNSASRRPSRAKPDPAALKAVVHPRNSGLQRPPLGATRQP
jgi:hypothetical protein